MFITPNQLIALLTDYLVESREWNLCVARSVATTHMVDRVANARGIRLYETPVGFKFIGELINKDEIVLGGEESAGLSIRGHYPEKDGILACLLAEEAKAAREAFLTAASIGVLPITAVDDCKIGTGRPGPIAARLGEAYWTSRSE